MSVSLDNGSTESSFVGETPPKDSPTWTQVTESFNFNYSKNIKNIKLRVDSRSASFGFVASDRAKS